MASLLAPPTNGVSSSVSSSSSASSASAATPITPMTPLDAEEPGEALAPALQKLAAARERDGLPQNIAHRGFRARYPENSLAAFRGALDRTEAAGDDVVGGGAGGGGYADALETDVHLTRDKVVVLSHDPTLRRCFGRQERIADCDWAFLEPLRTTQAPHVPLARLADLLAFLAEPGREGVWVLLDIKRDDDPEELVGCIAETIKAAPGGDWSRRIVLGCWDANYMRVCRQKLPGYALAFIGFSLSYAEELLYRHDGVVQVFNLLQTAVLVGGRGARFVRAAHARGRQVVVWTVNAEEWMDRSVRLGVDGVITDDPAKFRAVRRRWEGDESGGLEGEEGEEGKGETTPLKVVVRRTPATTPHPPTARSVTGWYLRRWARLYAVAGLLKTLVFVFTGVMRLRLGPDRARVDKALAKQ